MTERFQKTVQALEQGGVNSMSLLAGVRDSSVSSGIEAVDRTEVEPGGRKSTDNYRRILSCVGITSEKEGKLHTFREGKTLHHLENEKHCTTSEKKKYCHVLASLQRNRFTEGDLHCARYISGYQEIPGDTKIS